MTHPSVEASLDVSAVGTLPVGQIMTREVATLHPGLRLTQAMGLFVDREHSSMPVVDAGRLVGILSDHDLMRVLGRGAAGRYDGVREPLRDDELRATFALRCTGATVGAVMTRDVLTVCERTLVAEAARLMARDHIFCLPVVEGGRLTGVLTRDDLVRAQARGRFAPGAVGSPMQAESRDRELERQVKAEANDIRAGEWLTTRVHGGVATLEGRIGDEHRRLDLLRRIAALPGIGRIEDRMEMALDGIW